jgi:hypothetical protein
LVAAGKDRGLWITWLEEKMEVATMPKLVQSTPDRGFQLSEDFEFIIKTFASSDVLLLLRDNWDEYSVFLDCDQALKSRRDNMNLKYDSKRAAACATLLKKKLRAILVTCMNGKKQRLDATFIPSRELLVASQDGVPFVDIPDSDNDHWEMLKTLGVSIKLDISFYLRCLDRPEGSDDSARVAKLLDTIQFRCNDEADASIVK